MEGSLFHLTSETFITPSLANIAAEISANTKWDLEDDQDDVECFTPITRQSSIAEELKRTRSLSNTNYSEDSGDTYVNVEGKIQFLESALTYTGVWYYNTNTNCSEQSNFLYVKPRTTEAASSPTPASPFYSPSLLNMSPGPIRPTFYGKDIVGKWSGDFTMSGKRTSIQELFELHCNVTDNNSQEILAVYGEGHNLYGEFELTGQYEPATMKMTLRKYYKKSPTLDDPPYTPHDSIQSSSVIEHRVNLRKRRPSFLRSESDEYHSFSNLSFRLDSPSKKRGRGRPYKRINPPQDCKKRKLNNSVNGLCGYIGYSNGDYSIDKLCCVCSQYETPQDLFYKCISCGIIVHQSCYFIQPSQSKNNWKCDCCQYFDIPKTLYKTLSEYIQGIITNRSDNKSIIRVKLSYSLPVSKLSSITNSPQIYTCLSLLEGKSKIVECQICNKKKGAMKMTTSKTWCHVRCVLFSRSFMNTSLNCAPNVNSMDIKNQRYYQGCNDQIKKKPCFLCRKINGDIFQCCKWGCKYQFHINCSHSDDCLFMAYPSLLMDTCIPIIYCPDHAEQYMNNYYKTGERLIPAHLESDGEIYSGQTINGIREGFGVCLYSDSSMYEGDWHDGLPHGYGILCNNYNEIVYEGEYEKGKKQGCGTYYYINGDVYSGEWYQNKREGHGVYKTVNNEIYDCEWKNNEINGKGEYKSVNISYNGEWVKNVYEGQGVYKNNNGFEYTGTFKNGKMNGNGIIIYPDGKKYECLFKEGILTQKNIFISKMIQ